MLDSAREAFLYLGGWLVTLSVGIILITMVIIWVTTGEHDAFAVGMNTGVKAFRFKWFKSLIAVGVLGAVALTARMFVPSTKQMAVIVIVPKIVNNAEVQKIPGKIVDLCNEWADELKPSNILKKDEKK